MNKKLKILLTTDFVNVYGFGLFAPLYALYAISIGATSAQAAYIWSLYSLLGGVGMILFGKIENQFKHKERIAINGFVIQAAAVGILVFNDTLRGLIISLCAYAIGNSISSPAWKVMYAKLADRGHETEEWGLLDGGNSLLSAAAAASAGFIIQRKGFHGIIIVMFMAHCIGALLIMRLAKHKATPAQKSRRKR